MNLSNVLRKFYMKTHPDFFQTSPLHKTSNEKSLGHLRRVIDVFQQRPTGLTILEAEEYFSPHERETFPLTFYAKHSQLHPTIIKHPNSNKTDSEIVIEEENGAKFTITEVPDFPHIRKINIELRVHHNFSSTKSQLGKLFEIFDLPSDFEIETHTDKISLEEFFKTAIPQARAGTQSLKADQDQIRELKTLFFRQFGIYVSTKITSLSPVDLRQKLEESLSIFHLVGKKFQHHSLLISEDIETALVDDTICFNSNQSAISWLKLLQNSEPSPNVTKLSIDEKNENPEQDKIFTKISQSEISLSEALGCLSVNLKVDSDHELDMEIDGYINWLETILKSKKKILDYKSSNTRAFRKFRGLSIIVLGEQKTQEKQKMEKNTKKSWVSEKGDLLISTSITNPMDLINVILTQGPLALEQQKKEQIFEQKRSFIIARLGLTDLRIHEDFQRVISWYSKEKEAIINLSKSVEVLREISQKNNHLSLSKLTIEISDHYAVEPSTLRIRWNFVLEEVEKLLLAAGNENTKQQKPNVVDSKKE